MVKEVAMSHERRALWMLWAVMRRHMMDEFGEIRPGGCYGIVCRALDGEGLLAGLEMAKETSP